MDHAVSIVKYDIILSVIILRIVMVITRLFLSHEEVCCLRKVANHNIEKLFFETFSLQFVNVLSHPSVTSGILITTEWSK